MSDAYDYLEEGFDPHGVTVPRLRSILVAHNVDYPSTAKKGQLVELVNEHVLSQAPKLRAQRARAKRSSLGFINVGSVDDSNEWHDDAPTPRSRQSSYRRSMSPRKSSAPVKAEPEEDPEPNALRSPRKRSSRSASRQLSHGGDDHVGPGSVSSRSARRVSRRTVTPQIKAESEPEEDGYPTYANHPSDYSDLPQGDDEQQETVFTDDNPFQSGSSPLPVATPSSRRRTLGEDVKSSRSTRRQTNGIFEKPKKSRHSEMSSQRLRHRTPNSALEPGEEFTVDEQLELEDAVHSGEVAFTPRKRGKPARQTSLLTPLFVLLMALFGAYGAWYRQEKLAVGYCGLGRAAKPLLPDEVAVPEALEPLIVPQCEPCPQNAYCYEGFVAKCGSGFIRKPHPLSFGGLVPLPPTCEPDSEKERRAQAVADKAIEELRDRRAKYECGVLVDAAGHQADSPAVAEKELKEAVGKKRSKRLSDEEFEDLWDKAIGKVTTREEVEVEVETAKFVLDPTDRPIPPVFQSESFRQPLSLDFRSHAPSRDLSGLDWQDIDSQLDF